MTDQRATERPVQRIVIVGGGSAGWLTACVLGSEFDPEGGGIEITVVESPDIAPIGVGEGTWPSMRSTLQKIGISERRFLDECSASLKQGTAFRDWGTGTGDHYYHPFTLPRGYEELNLAEYWLDGLGAERAFADAVTAQAAICDNDRAPKQPATPDYAYVLNYGYHLDAARFGSLLRRHAVDALGVRHVPACVDTVEAHANGDIRALLTDRAGRLEGDFFVDCSGFQALLIGRHYGIAQRPLDGILFNDRALAVQVPYPESLGVIASTTRSTAREAGWIWDIGLQNRRGIGYVYSQRHGSSERAESVLDQYLRDTGRASGLAGLSPRLLRFSPGYRERPWHRNCVAIGLAAGFVEPLEASALVLVELAARAVAERLPATREGLDSAAAAFNDEFADRWEQVVDFLKLHYVLSRRSDSAYWRDHRDDSSLTASLRHSLATWQHRIPWHMDERRRDDMFPSASYQYILLGMGYRPAQPPLNRRHAERRRQRASALLAEVERDRQRYLQHLPANRDLLRQLAHPAPTPRRAGGAPRT